MFYSVRIHVTFVSEKVKTCIFNYNLLFYWVFVQLFTNLPPWITVPRLHFQLSFFIGLQKIKTSQVHISYKDYVLVSSSQRNIA